MLLLGRDGVCINIESESVAVRRDFDGPSALNRGFLMINDLVPLQR